MKLRIILPLLLLLSACGGSGPSPWGPSTSTSNNGGGGGGGGGGAITVINVAPSEAPTIVSTVPAGNATSISVSLASVTVNFSEGMDFTSLDLTLKQGAVDVAGTVTTPSTTQAVFTLGETLQSQTVYTVSVAGVVDLDDGLGINGSAAPFTYSFTTENTVTPVPPTVTATTPTGGATGVAYDATPITVDFSEDMDFSALSFGVDDSGTPVAGTVTTPSATRAVFTPSGALAAGASYSVSIDGATDVNDGLSIDNNSAPYTFSFTTASATAPTVTATSPSDGAVGVITNLTEITVDFSEDMDFTGLTLTVDDSGTPVAGTVTTPSATRAVFTPSGALSAGVTYTVSVDGAVDQQDGLDIDNTAAPHTFSFTTDPTTAPTVTATSPGDGATGVAYNLSTVTVDFSEDMDFTGLTFTVTDGVTPVTGTVTTPTATRAVFTLSEQLASNTSYTVEIDGAVDVADGLEIDNSSAPYTFSFTSVAYDVPTVTATSPADGATGVAYNVAEITVDFSEDMDFTGLSFTVMDGVTPLAGTVTTPSPTRTVFTPTESLASNTSYTVSIDGVVDADDGIEIDNSSAPYTFSFTSATYDVPTVTATSPVNGATGVAYNLSQITVDFSEDMDFSALTITVMDGGTPLAGSASSTSATRAVYNISTPLDSGVSYLVSVDGAVALDDGMDIDNSSTPYTFSFTAQVYDIPTVTSTDPADGSFVDPGFTPDITVNFSEPMDFTGLEMNVTHSDGVYVAVGTPTEIYTSTDRVTWTARNGGFADIVYGVASNNLDRIIAVGRNTKMAWSSDGVNWTQITTAIGARALYNVTASLNRWVVVGGSGTIMISDDNGDTWRLEPTGETASFVTVDYDGATWVAAGDSGVMYTTTALDQPWVPVTSGFGVNTVRSVKGDESGNWVAVGDGGTVSTSSDATNWTVRPVLFGGVNIREVLYNGGRWVALGESGNVATSVDNGATWTTHAPAGTGTPSGVVAEGLYVVASSFGDIRESADGEVWTTDITMFDPDNMFGLTYHPTPMVPGTITTPAVDQVVFTPDSSFTGGSYTITINGVVDTDDGIPLNNTTADYTFGFSAF